MVELYLTLDTYIYSSEQDVRADRCSTFGSSIEIQRKN